MTGVLVSLVTFTFVPWDALSSAMKGRARTWFIDRAVSRGVDWYGLRDQYEVSECTQVLQECSADGITYPDYYTRPFHGYDAGNLCWDAARENEASTLSMSLGYWPELRAHEASCKMRNAFVDAIPERPRINASLVDFGCSIGISTTSSHARLCESGWNFKSIVGIDLSPYFLSIARLRSASLVGNFKWLHANVDQECGLPNATADIVLVSFVLHEMPNRARLGTLAEAMRLLRPKGWIGILDLSPHKLKDRLSRQPWRKWAFEATEPHIFDYYNSDICGDLDELGFGTIVTGDNDPVNSWIWAQKE